MDGLITVSHEDGNGRILLAGAATCAGMEVFGDIDRLLATGSR